MAVRPLVIIHMDFEAVIIMDTKALVVMAIRENTVIAAVEIAVAAVVRTESREVACTEVEAAVGRAIVAAEVTVSKVIDIAVAVATASV